jgi:hypothetical protein
MKLSSKSKDYLIPEYSLTGDILSFLTCKLQYRYQNKGSLPPSRPLQLWFGEFIHGVMEEAYVEWKLNNDPFPWDWLEKIRPIEEKIDERMQARGLYPPDLEYFIPYQLPDDSSNINMKKPPQKILSQRTEAAINVWGKDIFPLIDSTEVLIKGLRKMPNLEKKDSRADYYCINGIIDVLSSVKIHEKLEKENSIIEYLKKTEEFKEYFKNSESGEYEIIIDYKGMRRPVYGSDTWKNHCKQILTYSWLKCRQDNSKPIIAGIIFYLNELVPVPEDLKSLKNEVVNNKNDVPIDYEDEMKIKNWEGKHDEYLFLSDKFKKDRSIRIIKVDDSLIMKALKEFDEVVGTIENSTIKESEGTPIKQAWKADGDERTCDACDFKNICSNYRSQNKDITIP